MPDYYKKVATHYDRRWKKYTQRTLDKIQQYLPYPLHHVSLLDYGCGTGELLNRLLQQSIPVKLTGYDPSDEMLKQAKAKLQHLPDYHTVCLQNKPDFNEQFDIIVSSSVLHYLPDPADSLKKLKNLLKPEGCLLILDYTKKSLPVRYFEWAIRLLDSAHHQAYTAEQILQLLRNAGLSIRQHETFQITLLWQGFIVESSSRTNEIFISELIANP